MGRSPCCSKVGLNRGAWTALEDKILKDYIRIHGEGKWRNLPKKAGLKRCGKSCRLRWLNYLRPDIKRGNITHDEEELIVRLHKLLGNRWSLIAGRLPGRTDNEIKNYWNTTLGKKVQGTMLNTWSPNQICNSSKDKKKSAMEASSLLPPPPPPAAAAAPSPNMESRVIRTKALRCNRVILPPQELDPAAYMNEEHNVNCQISQEGSSEAFFIPTSGDNPDDMLDINVGDFCFKDLLFDTDLTQLCHLDGGNGTEGGLDCNINNNSASKELSPCSDLEPLPYPDDEMLKDWTGNNCIQPDAGSDLRSLASFLDSDDDWLREQ